MEYVIRGQGQTSAKRVEILAFPDAQLLDICGPLQVFSTANDLSEKLGNARLYDYVVVSRTPGVPTTSGLIINSEVLPSPTSSLNTLVVAGGKGVDAACEDLILVKWITQRAQIAQRVASVCSGAFLLAEAGLLEGKTAVTHWIRCNDFRERFPNVRVDPDRVFIQNDNIWTSAGVTAGIDLCLALVAADHGNPLALAIAQYLVMFLKRPGGQSQFSATLSLQGDDQFDRLHTWIHENLNRKLPLEELAQYSGMSSRNFSRRYKLATGKTPAHAIEEIRVEAARRLLEQGRSGAAVAQRCGFTTYEKMRRSFMRTLGIGPRDYAERFGADIDLKADAHNR